jgi:simple sugar transport system ATP-binding protein
MNQKHIGTFAADLIDSYDIKTPQFDVVARTLSGGNLQKVVVAREFSFDSPLLVVAQPTRGIDIASAQYIREVLIEMRNNGRAILLVSTDLDEVFSISDRILVMYEGEIAGEFQPEATTREELGLYMIGARHQNRTPEQL